MTVSRSSIRRLACGYDKKRGSPVQIRSATVDDAAGLASVHIRSWQVAHRGIVPQERLDRMDLAARTANTRGILADPRTAAEVRVVTDGTGTIVGFVNFGPLREDDLLHPTEGEIRAIYADPGHWGAGVGRLLMTT